jgi:DNA polymerase-3 subunit delta
MAQKKAHEVDGWLARPDLSVPFVLIYGPDRGLVSERAAAYAAGTGLPLDDPFSVFRAEAADLEQDPARLEAELHTVAMFAARRLAWLRGFTSQRAVGEILTAVMNSPPPDLILLVEAGDLKKTAPLRVAAEKARTAICLPCYVDDAAALDRMIDGELEKAGIGISLEARQYLKSLLGGDRMASRGEVAKLALYCLERGRIDIEDVRQLVGDVGGTNPDEIVDAVLSGNLAAFEREFTRVEMAGSPGFQIFSALLRQLHQLQALRGAMESSGRPASAVVATARPPVFFKRKAIVEGALQRWDMEMLSRYLSRLQNAVLEGRRRPQLATALTRQFLLSMAVDAARRR